MHFWVVLLLICLAISSPVEVVSSPNHNNQDSDNVPLVTFDGAEGTTYKFHVLNDPVMVRILFRFLMFLIIAWIIKLMLCSLKG